MKSIFIRTVSILLLTSLLAGCASVPPANVNNICSIFKQKRHWYQDAKKAYQKWGIPVHVQAAIIHQESRFRATAKPPRKKIFGLLPGPRPSSAYGYAQALDTTWEWYQLKNNKYWAKRENFSDATDFIGWYSNLSHNTAGIAKWDAFNQYLAYHEGHGGYLRKTYRDKRWLIHVAHKVKNRALKYQVQLKSCQHKLS